MPRRSNFDRSIKPTKKVDSTPRADRPSIKPKGEIQLRSPTEWLKKMTGRAEAAKQHSGGKKRKVEEQSSEAAKPPAQQKKARDKSYSPPKGKAAGKTAGLSSGACGILKRRRPVVDDEADESSARPSVRRRLTRGGGKAAGTPEGTGEGAEQKAEGGSSASRAEKGPLKASVGEEDSKSSDPSPLQDAPAASTGEKEQSSSKKTESESAGDKAGDDNRKKATQPPRGISGLVNNSQQCFANSVLQFFDAALEGHDLDDVLGRPDSSHPFSTPDIKPGDKFQEPVEKGARKREGSKLSQIRLHARRLIEKCRDSGQQKHLSLKKHLRELLDRIRRTKDNGKEEHVSAMVLQQILAFRDPKVSQEHLNGDRQQDSLEYFQAVYNGLQSSDSDQPADKESQCDDKLRNLFTMKTEEATACSNRECDYKGTPHADFINAHTVRIDSRRKTEQSLMDLLGASTTSDLDSACEKCGEQTLQRVTEFTEMPDNVVIHVNRIHDNQVSKVMTPVSLPQDPVVIGGKEYMMTAVVKHRGGQIARGHYTAYRRRSSEWVTDTDSQWFHFDDAEIYDVSHTVVASDRGKGQTTLVLLKATGS